MHKRSIFWFRQDLRIYDNRWFIEAVTQSEEILPIFILDKNIVESFGWLEDKKFWFIREMLENLDSEIKKRWGEGLEVFHDYPEKLIPELIKTYSINTIFANTSYSSYWKKRDEKITSIIWKQNFIQIKDFVLQEPQQVEQRKVFTPYYKLWQKNNFDTIEQNISEITTFQTKQKKQASDFIILDKHPYFSLKFWKTRLENFIRTDYQDFRNDLDKDGTSKLSPYMRFWVFSIRQIYNIAKQKSDTYVSEMAWREFWMQIFYNFPETKSRAFQEKKRYISWQNDETLFQKWCDWETGYPVVDAAMKQLVETHWMHGRARMIVASFLTKDLLIDWKWWEAFFKKHLLDYDEAVNIGNWQWSASVWADPKPLRIFSPILQSQRFDPNATFIKKYLPELQWEELKAIHDPLKYELSYIPLIVDHSEAQRRARAVYKQSAIDFDELKN